MSSTFTAMAGAGHAADAAAEVARRDRSATRCSTARMLVPFRWSRRTVILLVMQTVDAAMHLQPKRKLLRPGRAAADRAGPRAAEPDLHPGRRRRRPAGSPSGPAASPRAR